MGEGGEKTAEHSERRQNLTLSGARGKRRRGICVIAGLAV